VIVGHLRAEGCHRRGGGPVRRCDRGDLLSGLAIVQLAPRRAGDTANPCRRSRYEKAAQAEKVRTTRLAGLDKGGRSALFRENKGGHNILFTRKSAIPPSCPPFPGNGSENIGSSKPKVGAPENEAQVDLEAGKWAVDYTENTDGVLSSTPMASASSPSRSRAESNCHPIAIGRCFSRGSIATSCFSKTQRYKVDRLSLFRKTEEAIRGTAERPGSRAAW
jgi:hypothetical protein